MIQVTYKCGHEDVISGFVSGPDYAGGVSVLYSLKNISEKTIKYYSLTFLPYNAVGDVVKCSISNLSECSVKGTGPVGKNCKQNNKILRTAWYNPSITKVALVSAEIEYTDGTKETIDGKDIKPISGGCYVATAVYGSYDCPQVWTLRRYRDFTLAETWYGRAFIRTYYAISPTLVKWFGNTNWFKKLWKGKLDRMVSKLNNKGVENTPYEDKQW